MVAYNTDVSATVTPVGDSSGGSTTSTVAVLVTASGTGTPSPTISAVGSLASNAGNGVTTLSVDPSHVGDALLAVVKVSSATTTVSSLSGGGATGWSKLESYADGSHDNEIWLSTVTTTGSATLTATFSASVSGVDVDFNAQEFTAGLGSGTTWSKDTGSGQSNSAGSTFDFPSLTPAGRASCTRLRPRRRDAVGGDDDGLQLRNYRRR